MEDDISIIFSKFSEEKKTGELLPLPIDFYSRYGNNTNDESRENKNKTISALKAKRMQKILVYLAYGRPLPQQVPEEEKHIYQEIKKLISQKTKEDTKKLKILIKIPEIITPEGQKIGPYEKNQIIETSNNSNVEYILKNKIGEIIEQ
jgi:hypothetical protein